MAAPELRCDLEGWDAITKQAFIPQLLGMGLAGAGAAALSNPALRAGAKALASGAANVLRPMAQKAMAAAPGMVQRAGTAMQGAWQRAQPGMQSALAKAKNWASGAAQRIGLTPTPAPPLAQMTNSGFNALNSKVQAGVRAEEAGTATAQAAAGARARLYSPSPAPANVNQYSAEGQAGHGAQQARAMGFSGAAPPKSTIPQGRGERVPLYGGRLEGHKMAPSPGVAPEGANAPLNRYAAELSFDPPRMVKRSDEYNEEPGYAPTAALGAGVGAATRNALGDAGSGAMNTFKNLLKGRNPGRRFAPHGPTFGSSPIRIRPGTGLAALGGAALFSGGDWLSRRLSETD